MRFSVSFITHNRQFAHCSRCHRHFIYHTTVITCNSVHYANHAMPVYRRLPLSTAGHKYGNCNHHSCTANSAINNNTVLSGFTAIRTQHHRLWILSEVNNLLMKLKYDDVNSIMYNVLPNFLQFTAT